MRDRRWELARSHTHRAYEGRLRFLGPAGGHAGVTRANGSFRFTRETCALPSQRQTLFVAVERLRASRYFLTATRCACGRRCHAAPR